MSHLDDLAEAILFIGQVGKYCTKTGRQFSALVEETVVSLIDDAG